MWVVLSRPDCPWCDKAVNLLDACELIDLTDKDYAWIRKLLLSTGVKTVPQIFSPEGDHIGGYHDLVRYLEKNGTTKT